MPSFCLTFGGPHGGITRWHPSAPDHEGTGIHQFDVTHLARRFWTYHLTIVTAINYALYRAIGFSTQKVYCAILHERLAVQVYTDDMSSIILGTVGTDGCMVCDARNVFWANNVKFVLGMKLSTNDFWRCNYVFSTCWATVSWNSWFPCSSPNYYLSKLIFCEYVD